MLSQETIDAKLKESVQLFNQIKSLLDDHEFGIIMTAMTNVMLAVLATYTENDDEAIEILAKFVDVIIEERAEVCDCPKCEAKRRAMN